MQVDPFKPKLKAPGTERLKLQYEKLVSSVAFNFNLRRYSMAMPGPADVMNGTSTCIVVGQCRMTLSNPR